MVKTYKDDDGNVHLDRRSGNERRSGDDRRQEYRFEPGKENRRGGKDRRKKKGYGWEFNT